MARPYYNRALALFAKSDHKASLADFDQAIKLEPTDSEAFANRAIVHEAMGNQAAAKADYQQVLTLQPTHNHAKEALARLMASN